MTREKFSRHIDMLRRFTVSGWYGLLLVTGACIAIFSGQGVLWTYIFAIFITATMVITEDLMPVLQGMVALICFAIRLKDSAADFVELWPLSIPVFIGFFAHLYLYPVKFRKPGVFWGMMATSLAIVLGGAGKIYWKSYFSPTSLFYMVLLGFGMVIIACYLSGGLHISGDYDFEDKFCRTMALAIVILSISLFQEYFSRRAEFLGSMSVLAFQWRNNASTILMIAMPFAFYFAAKKFRYFFLALLAYAGIIFTGSRGGLLFGAVELGICIMVMTIIDRKHRKFYIATVLLCLATAVAASHWLLELVSYTLERFTDPKENNIRLELIERGIKDFKNSPIFGQGLGYMGNRDVHASAKHTLCWYHCSLVQVPASFGIVGIAAYIFLNINRVKVFIKNISFFSIILFLSFIGLELMSLVNPGIFVPYPYLFFVTVYFVVMENCNKGGKESITALMKGDKQ